jgi:tRNA modification GTPase
LLRVHAKADQPGKADPPAGALPVSAVTGLGLANLAGRIVDAAREVLPVDGELALNRRQALELEQARVALKEAAGADLVCTAEALRVARAAFDRLSGRAGIEDMLDALFGRFCLGK